VEVAEGPSGKDAAMRGLEQGLRVNNAGASRIRSERDRESNRRVRFVVARHPVPAKRRRGPWPR